MFRQMTIRETRSYVLFSSRFGHWCAHFHACSTARGPLSATLVSILRSSADPREITAAADAYEDAQSTDLTYDILRDDDAQLTLTLLYELHLQGIENVSDKWEWNPDLLAVRSRLEERFESAIAQLVGTVESSGDVVADLWSMTAPSAGPGLASFMAKDATIDQFSEVLIHRSLNQLREAMCTPSEFRASPVPSRPPSSKCRATSTEAAAQSECIRVFLPTPCGL